jgi:L-threonylcarbamoyladenylate synthase
MTMTADITKAAETLDQGGLVAFPTETVYGLGADASNALAIRKIFQAKERPYDHPLIVHVSKIEEIYHWAREVSEDALKIANVFWPGALTLILKKQPHVLDIVTGNQDTVGLRIPNHPVAQALLTQYGKGIAAPSANKFTHISPTTAEAVFEELGNEVDIILEGGACQVGLESTILDMTSDIPVMLRPGMITKEMIEKVLGKKIHIHRQDKPNTTRVPGMHHLHYAPATKTVLLSAANINAWINHTQNAVLLIRATDAANYSHYKNITPIIMPDDSIGYAQNLYQQLRAADHQNYECIGIFDVPTDSDWLAIKDRISKATATRS